MKTQFQIVQETISLLKKKGMLKTATKRIIKEENLDNLVNFINKNKEKLISLPKD